MHEPISLREARDLGLHHVGDNDVVTATSSRKSVAVTSPTGDRTTFTRGKEGWQTRIWARHPASEVIPYDTYLAGKAAATATFHDRRSQ